MSNHKYCMYMCRLLRLGRTGSCRELHRKNSVMPWLSIFWKGELFSDWKILVIRIVIVILQGMIIAYYTNTNGSLEFYYEETSYTSYICMNIFVKEQVITDEVTRLLRLFPRIRLTRKHFWLEAVEKYSEQQQKYIHKRLLVQDSRVEML